MSSTEPKQILGMDASAVPDEYRPQLVHAYLLGRVRQAPKETLTLRAKDISKYLNVNGVSVGTDLKALQSGKYDSPLTVEKEKTTNSGPVLWRVSR